MASRHASNLLFDLDFHIISAIRTGKLFTPCRAGGVMTAPVLMLNREPCQGQVTSSPAMVPSDKGPPR